MALGVTSFAEAASGGILGTLGIDGKLLLFQIIAFLVVLWILKKWVYPPFLNILEKRDAVAAEAAKSIAEAAKQAKEAKDQAEKVMIEAHKEAALIMSTAKQEAMDLSETSDKKARARAERIVTDAHDQTVRDIESAKNQLRAEMIDLVASATEKVTSNVVDAKTDKAIITKSLKDAA